MKSFLIFPMVILTAVVLCSIGGCISYTTLQTPDTLPPGKSAFGLGVSTGAGPAVTLEAGGRLGIAKNFDAGLKYSAPSLFFLDGKLQLLDAPLTVSADLGFSVFSYENHNQDSRSTAFYPMVLVGQRHWYAGLKETYLSTTGTLDLFGKLDYSGSTWMGPSVVLGGWLGDDSFRVLGEVNVMFFNGKTGVVPAIGLQFRP